jgi:hypothetical protein
MLFSGAVVVKVSTAVAREAKRVRSGTCLWIQADSSRLSRVGFCETISDDSVSGQIFT